MSLLNTNYKQRIKDINSNNSLSTLNSNKIKNGDKLLVGNLNISSLALKFDESKKY